MVLSGDAEIDRQMRVRYAAIKAANFPDVADATVSDVVLSHTFWPPTRPGWVFVDCRGDDEMVRVRDAQSVLARCRPALRVALLLSSLPK